MKELLVEKAVEVAQREREVGGQIVIITPDEIADIKRNIELVLEETVTAKIRSHIDIPNIALVAVGEAEKVIEEFDLDTRHIYAYKVPNEEMLIENLKTGKIDTAVISQGNIEIDGTPAQYILGEVLNQNPFIPYSKYGELLFKLVGQMLDHLGKDKTEQELKRTLIAYKKEIAKEISSQLNEHSRILQTKYEMKVMQRATTIRTESYTKIKSDSIIDFKTKVPAYKVRKVVFGNFTKSCTDIVKFDSVPEHDFSVVLERSGEVVKWLRPVIGQLPISASGGSQYQPDFIVETATTIYIIEVKAKNELDDEGVLIKNRAAQAYCDNVNSVFAGSAKKWHFAMIADYNIARNMSFEELVARAERWSRQ